MADRQTRRKDAHEVEREERGQAETCRRTETCVGPSWPPSSTCGWPAGEAGALNHEGRHTAGSGVRGAAAPAAAPHQQEEPAEEQQSVAMTGALR